MSPLILLSLSAHRRSELSVASRSRARVLKISAVGAKGSGGGLQRELLIKTNFAHCHLGVLISDQKRSFYDRGNRRKRTKSRKAAI